VQGIDVVLDAVQRCWASLWTARAIGYRMQHGIDQETVALAVVVQQLVPAEAAGVMFTANPFTGRRDQVMISAAWGLGETVVGGTVVEGQDAPPPGIEVAVVEFQGRDDARETDGLTLVVVDESSVAGGTPDGDGTGGVGDGDAVARPVLGSVDAAGQPEVGALAEGATGGGDSPRDAEGGGGDWKCSVMLPTTPIRPFLI
ncbi:MAG TPA: hypothetical protein ENN99_07300, partial [Chloroflexi bacterium]|nr:hypothetical protein [Chloroflexota bacterium]